jgi:hypothetical protein
LDLALVVVADPIPEEFIGNPDFKGVLPRKGGFCGFKPGFKALAINVFFKVLKTPVPEIRRRSHPQTSKDNEKRVKVFKIKGNKGGPKTLSPACPQQGPP